MSSEAATPESEGESKSDSSTVVYDHEPFETFKARVLELCQQVLGPPKGEISIKRMHGGGFNRIVGISVTSSGSPTASQYVLRVPRFDAARLDRDLAPLQLLLRRSKIKIPEVIAFDTTSHNVLESPYMIQTRIPGSPLFPAYPDLPHEMKCAIAYELGKVFLQLNFIRSVVAGRPTLSPSQRPLKNSTIQQHGPVC
jgi:hypothetical protein